MSWVVVHGDVGGLREGGCAMEHGGDDDGGSEDGDGGEVG